MAVLHAIRTLDVVDTYTTVPLFDKAIITLRHHAENSLVTISTQEPIPVVNIAGCRASRGHARHTISIVPDIPIEAVLRDALLPHTLATTLNPRTVFKCTVLWLVSRTDTRRNAVKHRDVKGRDQRKPLSAP